MPQWNEFPTCDNCVYSDDAETPADPSLGKWLLCRRRAPRVFDQTNDGFPGGTGIFPRVQPTDWCGDWRRCPINTGIRARLTFLDAMINQTEEC